MRNDPLACDRCVARSWLLGRLAGHLEAARGRIEETLALPDEQLIDALGGGEREAIRREFVALDATEQRRLCAGRNVQIVCRCDSDWYPARLADLDAQPAVLHVAGGVGRLLELLREPPVAIVGSRRASDYGREVARSLARDLAGVGLPVVSGMALGIDAAAHTGALEAMDGRTIAVLPCGADRPYPAAKRQLYRRIATTGVAVSELPPGLTARRWMFPARNRIIAALAAVTVVVEAGERSGSLITARVAGRLGRGLGAVPGRVTSPLSAGPHALLAEGAMLVRGPSDVLEELYGPEAPEVKHAHARPRLDRWQNALLREIGDGRDAAEVVAAAGLTASDGLAALASLELDGYLRRTPGGRYAVIP